MTAVEARAASLREPSLHLLTWLALAVALGGAAAIRPTLGVAVAAALVLWFAPIGWGLGALFAAATLQTVVASVGPYAIPAAAPVATVLALRVLCSRDRARLTGIEFAFLGFLALAAFTSALSSPDIGLSLRTTALFGAGVCAYLAVGLGLLTRASMRTALRAFLALAVSNAVVGVVAVAAHAALGTVWGVTILEQPAGFPAASGLSFEHNLFGSSCAIAGIALLGLWRVPNGFLGARSARLGWWACAAGVLLSLTRGAWLAFAVGLVLVLRLTRCEPERRPLSSLVGQGVVLVALGGALVVATGSVHAAGEAAVTVTGSVAEQAGRVFEFGRGTGYLRASEARTAVTEAPVLLGAGVNTYGTRHSEPTVHGPVPSYLGNWLVRTFHDTGIAGLLLFGAGLLAVAWPGRRTRSAKGEDAAVLRVLCAAAVAMLLAYVAADAFLLVWPWTFLGLVRAVRREALEA